MYIGLLILLITGAALALIAVGARMPAKEVSIEDRLAAFAERPRALEELELERPFTERVLMPLLGTWTRRLARFTPAQNAERLRQQLLEAGSPNGLGVVEFMGLRALMALLLGGTALFLTFITGSTLRPIDLLTISVEAGLGFDPALQRVAEKWDNALSREFSRMLQEMRIGKARRDAMREVSARCNVEDLRIFISSIVQADQLGVSITQVLRIQSEQMRIRRRQRAEELAHKAPIKMLFPMVFLIFPAMFVVILGPALPGIFKMLGN